MYVFHNKNLFFTCPARYTNDKIIWNRRQKYNKIYKQNKQIIINADIQNCTIQSKTPFWNLENHQTPTDIANPKNPTTTPTPKNQQHPLTYNGLQPRPFNTDPTPSPYDPLGGTVEEAVVWHLIPWPMSSYDSGPSRPGQSRKAAHTLRTDGYDYQPRIRICTFADHIRAKVSQSSVEWCQSHPAGR